MKEYKIALAGNPNVGKSTVFNLLTGLRRHTGNWPGKSVDVAEGVFELYGEKCRLIDLPGTYSLISTSEDEELARNYICFGDCNLVLIVADATAVERNLNLVLQAAEAADNCVLCVNLIDEAKKRNIKIDFPSLEKKLGIPVVPISARHGQGMSALKKCIYKNLETHSKPKRVIEYPEEIENAVSIISHVLPYDSLSRSRFVALKLLEDNSEIVSEINKTLYLKNPEIKAALDEAVSYLDEKGIKKEALTDIYAAASVKAAEKTARLLLSGHLERTLKADKIITSKYAALPLMLLLLGLVFFITLTGANYPSQLLGKLFFGIEKYLRQYVNFLPPALKSLLIDGMYHTLAWVVSVMLPPMAIFFPMFALLEDFGYLPRIAFNLDKCFKCAGAHGRQALTMCQGFGCNACGVMGCRIINSPRERLIAVITNSLVPCNGRFPTLIILISLFFSGNNLSASLFMLLFIIFSVIITLAASKLLSATLLKGIPSSFAMELPPFRKPRFIKVTVRSFLDKTLSVLLRAVIVAIPAGAIIWLLANLTIDGTSLLKYFCDFLDPLGKAVGMDGCILAAFILGFPANEIVIPLMIMTYMGTSTLSEPESTAALGEILKNNGWTYVTALCVIVFCLVHFPCGTTCRTIYKETKSIKWTAVSVLLPTIAGLSICFLISLVSKLLPL